MPAVDALGKWMSRAQSLRNDLGLTPKSFAAMARYVSLTRKAQDDAIGRAAEAGRRIRERREPELRAAAADGEGRGLAPGAAVLPAGPECLPHLV